MPFNPIHAGRARASLATLRRGDSHADARLLKRLLAATGCTGIPASYGDHAMQVSNDVDADCVTGIREAQIRSNGKLKVDGICGPMTWAWLLGIESLPDAPKHSPSRARLIGLLANLPRLEQLKNAGNAFTDGKGNACAATASQVLIYLGVRNAPELWAQTLADETEAAGWQRVIEPSAVKRGDMIVCIDGNGNGAADHVWFALGDAYMQQQTGRFVAQCFDNRRDVPIGYTRNLTGKGYTRMAYALRLS